MKYRIEVLISGSGFDGQWAPWTIDGNDMILDTEPDARVCCSALHNALGKNFSYMPLHDPAFVKLANQRGDTLTENSRVIMGDMRVNGSLSPAVEKERYHFVNPRLDHLMAIVSTPVPAARILTGYFDSRIEDE